MKKILFGFSAIAKYVATFFAETSNLPQASIIMSDVVQQEVEKMQKCINHLPGIYVGAPKIFLAIPSLRITYLRKYWHIGSSRKASAMVAITAVHMANNNCIESKKKNITNREMEAPTGRHIACSESRVWTPDLSLSLADLLLSLPSSSSSA